MSSDDAWVGKTRPYLTPRGEGEKDAWTSEAAARGRQGGQRLLEAGEVEPPDLVRAFFGLGPGELAVVRRRLILLDGKPTELADSYYPGHIALGTPLAEPRKIPGGAVTLLADLGYEAAEEFEEDTVAENASPAQCELLGLPAGKAVQVLTRFVTSTTGEPMEASVMTMTRHHRYTQRRDS
ncbi:UTRA domain-containing protein [Streptomyces diastatochromogenes]|nr:UTRA domain-containing protein [Streptomyces diastatochromogenes]